MSSNKLFLGIELGSTRIKSVLISHTHAIVASGAHAWENALINDNWTYSLEDVWAGVQSSIQSLARDYNAKTKTELSNATIGGIGISAMMHGYLAFDTNGELLIPFRTWRNTTTEAAALALTKEFDFNIPQRWSIAHLYQAMLNEESHTKNVAFITTLAGYVHWKLTGEKVLGVGDASGVFPIDSTKCDYDSNMVTKFDALISQKGYQFSLQNILPVVKNAGDSAGVLTAEGVALLGADIFEPGIPLCPPEGDAGTGMIATNSVAVRTGNVSAGTSIFAMVVLEKALSNVHVEVDMVTTPNGRPVAMVHCNNCCTDIDAWVKLFGESLAAFGAKVDQNTLYDTLYRKALEGSANAADVLTYNYYSGEPITGFDNGRPTMIRTPNADFSLKNLMRSLVFSAIATLKIGMKILGDEGVKLDQLLGHGGFFKVAGVGQQLMAAALNVPVTVMESAGEGGAWGIAILSAYQVQKSEGETLDAYLSKLFANEKGSTIEPSPDDIADFATYMDAYVKGLDVVRAAISVI